MHALSFHVQMCGFEIVSRERLYDDRSLSEGNIDDVVYASVGSSTTVGGI